MAQFLTPAWMADVNASAMTSAMSVDPGLHVVLDQRVGEVTYRVTICSGRLSVGPADPDRAPDVTLTLDYDTAAGLAVGRLDAHQAFLAGRVKVSGNVAGLAAALPALAALGPALASLRDHTTY